MNKILNFYKRNLKEVLRDPIIYIFCLGFPIVMFLLFFIINKYSQGNTPMFEISSLLPAIIVFSYSGLTDLITSPFSITDTLVAFWNNSFP